MQSRQFSQGFCCLFRCQISLWHGHHLESNHKFSYRRRSKKRRVKMSVESPVGIIRVIIWGTIKTHAKIDWWNFEIKWLRFVWALLLKLFYIIFQTKILWRVNIMKVFFQSCLLEIIISRVLCSQVNSRYPGFKPYTGELPKMADLIFLFLVSVKKVFLKIRGYT